MPDRPPLTLPEHVADLARRMRKVETRPSRGDSVTNVAAAPASTPSVPHYAKIQFTSDISVADGEAVEWNSVITDTDSFVNFDTGEFFWGNGFIIPATFGGLYLLHVRCLWEDFVDDEFKVVVHTSNAGGGDLTVEANDMRRAIGSTGNGIENALQMSVPLRLPTGFHVMVFVAQSSGSAKNLLSYSTWAQLTLLGLLPDPGE